MRVHPGPKRSNCFISCRGRSLKEDGVGVITGAARVRGPHSNRQQCSLFSQANYFHRCCQNQILGPRSSHVIPLWRSSFDLILFAISRPSQAAESDESSTDSLFQPFVCSQRFQLSAKSWDLGSDRGVRCSRRALVAFSLTACFKWPRIPRGINRVF